MVVMALAIGEYKINTPLISVSRDASAWIIAMPRDHICSAFSRPSLATIVVNPSRVVKYAEYT